MIGTVEPVDPGGAVGTAGAVGVAESVYAAFGPFLIPVAVFLAGLVGYLLLVALDRARLSERD
jgi:hypothetical protein